MECPYLLGQMYIERALPERACVEMESGTETLSVSSWEPKAE